jgi:cytochrome c oxidase assembly protein subunit 16
MPIFPSKKFRPSSTSHTLAARYRVALAKHPFAAFGLPFLLTMVAGSFFLTPATALRYEKHDRKVRQMSEEERLGIGSERRRVDMREEYYVSLRCLLCFECGWGGAGVRCVGRGVWDEEGEGREGEGKGGFWAGKL